MKRQEIFPNLRFITDKIYIAKMDAKIRLELLDAIGHELGFYRFHY